jgi:KDO2-lipid IV(A) lauroyltransferase
MGFLLKILSRLSLPALYRVGGFLYVLSFHIVRWRRAVAARNIAAAFPRLSAAEHAAILRRSYRNLCDVMVEAVWSWGGADAAALRSRVTIENPELIQQHATEGRSVLLLTAHFCNWEWLLLAAGAQLGFPIDAVYKPPRQHSVDAFLREARARFGGNPIPYHDFIVEVMRRRTQVRAYAMVADQTPIVKDEKHWTHFLHQDTAFYVGADKIARILKAPVLFVAMQRVRRGHYRVRLSEIAAPPYTRDDSATIVERYARALEAEIRQSPPDWLWVHRKWKYGKPVYS